MDRPDWDTYLLILARAVALRADCSRRKVGCVIVDEDHRVLATGYNGSPPGGPSCLAGECPRGLHYRMSHFTDGDRWSCGCGADWPCPQASVSGSSYDTGAGSCVAVHAEANALLFARASVKGATLYCTDEPCGGCARLIAGAGIARVVVTPPGFAGTLKDLL